MKCRICGNDDENFFFRINDENVCRVCLKYRYPILKKESKIIEEVSYNLNYSLTESQLNISRQILKLVKDGLSVLVNAVCGAGKTEIIYDSIIYGLQNGKRIGIAIPRKDVVEELYQRIKKDFINISVERVYGGQTKKLEADVVIFTTHQAYRYINCFDLLFIDEVDAFPFHGNKVLESILRKCCIGPIVYMSATISKIKGAKTLCLNKRYHGFPIPIPKVVVSFKLRKKLLGLISQLISFKIILIYVGSIKKGEVIFSFLKKFYKEQIVFVNSKSNNKNKIIEQIKNNYFKVVITTTILERGITLEDAQIIIYEANNKVFDVSTLIQISGRAGRKVKYPEGKVYFLSTSYCSKFKKVIKTLEKANE